MTIIYSFTNIYVFLSYFPTLTFVFYFIVDIFYILCYTSKSAEYTNVIHAIMGRKNVL